MPPPDSTGPKRPHFDPGDAAAPESGLFGLDTPPDEAAVHVLGVPFDATTSFRPGTAGGPDAILRASHQIELFDPRHGRPYEAGIHMAPIDDRVHAWNRAARADAQPVIDAGGIGSDASLKDAAARVDAIAEELHAWVAERTTASLNQGKLCGLVGGDHSVALGSIEAHARAFPGMGILHFDAHADLRAGFEGFAFSHASILHNVVERVRGLGPIVQVGLRDLSEAEFEAIQRSEGRITAVMDHEWSASRNAGQLSVDEAVERILAPLPREVYVTLDVDGLDPSLCPRTGTPSPGGLTWREAMAFLDGLLRTNRRIVGFDLTEVVPENPQRPGEGWDEIVGAKLLYQLIGFALRS